ncbi:ethyl tert-butyl ether degradation protein EthD [Rhodococcus erythropolis]|uniref:EthD family reductase n=1 Tax=Rhodococcus qingshengii TaxID=334542 RepID=UPI0009356813|nr:EthD family reductase [Rhodococcus qingshengii]MCZ4548193.1 EthD family reductase [Rhodococcus qingshengii]OKA07023.1 ethyl tert-butyl ether degradation protein EthD [Rhodococcus erythropolis]REK75429.1 EthD family reductase [Rhodococcus erythropolis]
MHTLMVTYRPPVDPAAFRDHYRNKHLPLAAALPGLRTARYSLDVHHEQSGSSIFALFEGDFESEETMREALSSPEGAAAQADLQNFATGGVDIFDFVRSELP